MRLKNTFIKEQANDGKLYSTKFTYSEVIPS